MEGKATKHLQDETHHPVSVRKWELWRFLRCADSATELRIRRLSYWQRVARDMEAHAQVLGSVFGDLDVSQRNTLSAQGKKGNNKYGPGPLGLSCRGQ